jgi:hypothetical protein
VSIFVSLFVGYLMTLLVAHTINLRMIGWLMNNELEGVMKEADVA